METKLTIKEEIVGRKLHDRALECVRYYQRCEKELIDILELVDQNKTYLFYSVSSLFRYCVEKLGLSEAETYRFTQVTRKAAVVPELKIAIGDGRLTVSKASRIAPVIQINNQDKWIEKASRLNHRDLEREVAKEKPQTEKKEKIKIITSSRTEIRVTISSQLEVRLGRAKEVLRTKSLEETLEKMVELTLKYKDPLEKAKRAQHKPATCKVGPNLMPAAKFGRAIPSKILHQVNLRDQGKCTVNGCNEKKWTEIHHIRPLSEGGTHSLQNLKTLCWGHHRLTHEAYFSRDEAHDDEYRGVAVGARRRYEEECNEVT